LQKIPSVLPACYKFLKEQLVPLLKRACCSSSRIFWSSNAGISWVCFYQNYSVDQPVQNQAFLTEMMLCLTIISSN